MSQSIEQLFRCLLAILKWNMISTRVAVAGGGRAGRERVHREQPDSQKAPGLDVRPQGATENARRPRRLLPRWVHTRVSVI